jgi:hypothetical protein
MHRRFEASDGICSGNPGKTEQMIEGTILEHQYEDMLDVIKCHCSPQGWGRRKSP